MVTPSHEHCVGEIVPLRGCVIDVITVRMGLSRFYQVSKSPHAYRFDNKSNGVAVDAPRPPLSLP
jgi:hypothetical protein